MTEAPGDFVRRMRRRLVLQTLLRALGWGLAAGWLAPAAGFAAFAAVLWRARRVWSENRVALWLEENIPESRYALITALEADSAELRRRAQAVAEAAEPELTRRMRRRFLRSLIPIAPVLLLAALLQGAGWRPDWPGGGFMPVDPLARLSLELIPPAYTGWPAQKLEEVQSIGALAGTRAILRGEGSPEGLEARIGDLALQAQEAPGGWSLAFVMPEAAEALTLTQGAARRILVLEPRRDAAPQVQLILPEGDRLLSALAGDLELSARMSDDVGLAKGWFEVILASGEGEGNFEFVESVLLETEFDGPSGALRGALPLESFGLRPGGQISIRAAAADRNDLSGPGIGHSETRTLRLLRADQASDAAVIPAPPAADEDLMSLRMLIREAERLEARRPDLAPAAFAAAATPLSRHADAIRDKVQGLRDEADSGGAYEVPPLLELALESLWEGARRMAAAEPGEASPHLRRAYEALQAMRNLTRHFLRGEAAPAVADPEKVRMTGDEPVAAGPRSPRGREDSARVRMAARLAALRPDLRRRTKAAAEALTLLRVEALRDLPEAAPPLEAALQALGRGEDPSEPLARLRLLLEGPPAVRADLPLWAPIPGAAP